MLPRAKIRRQLHGYNDRFRNAKIFPGRHDPKNSIRSCGKTKEMKTMIDSRFQIVISNRPGSRTFLAPPKLARFLRPADGKPRNRHF
jgi:hypothetical protein